MMVQGYLEIDRQAMDADEFAEFNAFLSEYMIYYYRVDKADREYYFCVMRNHEAIDTLLFALADRTPTLNGLWQRDGLPFGQIKEISHDPETLEETITVTGEPEYSFDLNMHLSHTPSEFEYDENGDILSETPVTVFKPLHSFAGWIICQAY